MNIPIENGTYEVISHAFGPKKDYEDEIGWLYGDCVRILRVETAGGKQQ